jgi:hypothetical protein
MGFEAQILLGILAAGTAVAAPGQDGVGDVLRLGGGVLNAVCDESVAGKAPSIELARPERLDKSSSDLWFQLVHPMSEAQAMSLLLGDRSLPGAWIASPALQSRAQLDAKAPLHSPSVASRIDAVRRRISLEICSGAVDPARLQQLVGEQPSRFLSVEPRVGSPAAPTLSRDRAWIQVQDVDRRFGKVGKQWLAPGWIEPYELVSIHAGGREYRRLANAITNRTQFIAIMGRGDAPMGFVFPSAEPLKLDWTKARASAENEVGKQRRAETYRLLIELDAYRVLSRMPEQGDEVRKLQDYYRNLIGSYLQYPGEGQFTQYARKADQLPSEAELRKSLDTAFFAALEQARVNGAHVGFTLFLPDASLHGMYFEYRERLARMSVSTPAAGR